MERETSDEPRAGGPGLSPRLQELLAHFGLEASPSRKAFAARVPRFEVRWTDGGPVMVDGTEAEVWRELRDQGLLGDLEVLRQDEQIDQRRRAEGARRRAAAPKHTPGPWVAEHGGVFTAHPGRSEQTKVAEVAGLKRQENPPPEPFETYMANGRLIAAAPDLLEVARLAFRQISGDAVDRETVLDALSAAIAKASSEGR